MRRWILLFLLGALAGSAAAQASPGSMYAWLGAYAGHHASDAARDPLFRPMLDLSLPAWSLGMGRDRTLADSVATQMLNSSRRVQLRGGRYLEMSGYRSDGGVAQSFFWADLQLGQAIGAMYVCLGPAGGCAQQMLVFATHPDRATRVSQLPADFVSALAAWQAQVQSGPPNCHLAYCQVPAALTQYFVGPDGRSLLLHEVGHCGAGSGADIERCRAAEREASELDRTAAESLARATPSQPSRADWLAQRERDCGAPGAPADCYSRSNEARAAAILAQLPGGGLLATGPAGLAFNPPIPANQGACGRRTPVYQPDPSYSDAARQARIQGEVQARLSIAPDGSVTAVTIVQPLGYGLDEMAMQTLKLWRFRPLPPGCQPVDTTALVSLTFRLGPR